MAEQSRHATAVPLQGAEGLPSVPARGSGSTARGLDLFDRLQDRLRNGLRGQKDGREGKYCGHRVKRPWAAA